MEKRIETLEQMAIENLAEKVINIMEKISNYLQVSNKLQILGSLSEHSDEMEVFRNDLEKYGLGVFLWFKDIYPNIFRVFKKIGFLPSVIKIKEIRKAIEEYSQFIEMVKKRKKIYLRTKLKKHMIFLIKAILIQLKY
ncbi:MAG: hypothetical protein ACTSQP_20385 [Promethearchaeota archaeon]